MYHMRTEDFIDVADDILTSISRAVDSGNFTNLGKDVRRAVDEARNTIDVTPREHNHGRPRNENQGLNGIGNEIADSLDREFRGFVDTLKLNFGKNQTPYFSKHVNKGIGVVRLVFGIYLTVIGGVVSLYSIFPMSEPISFIVFSLIIFAVGVGLTISGGRARKLINNYTKYGKITGQREYITIRELADRTGQDENKVVNNLKAMLKKGYLPTAALDRQNSTLMLTQDVYDQYSKLASQQSNEEAIDKSIMQPNDWYKKDYYTIDDSLPEDVKEILKSGNEYLNKIRYYNDLIPDDEPMSDKLYTLEATVLSIFKKLQEEPNTAGELRKLMSYYLPTTEKLLQSYVDLRKQPDSLENIKKSQAEIEEATDVINDAFVKLLNQLFQNDAWDITSDISVMKTMMKQDSLL